MVKAIKNKKSAEISQENVEYVTIKDEIMKRMDGLEKRIVVLETKPIESPVEVKTEEIQMSSSGRPIPPEYRKLVNEILNSKFGINVEYDNVGNGFTYTIVVPDEYSAFTPEQKTMMGADLRSKVITYAEGINGVKKWTETVYGSFTPERKAKISADRK